MWHEPVLVKREVEECKQKFKDVASASKKGTKSRNILKDIIKDKSDEILAELPSLSSLRQQANRLKKSEKGVKEPKYLRDLVIDDSFKKTYKGDDFLLG